MVGRPNFPEDVDQREDLKGAALTTPGLTALDEEREASLADEGGVSGAVVESQDEEERQRLTESLPVSHLVDASTTDGTDEGGWVAASVLCAVSAVLAVAALGVLLLRRS
jgi:hypothetical protein